LRSALLNLATDSDISKMVDLKLSTYIDLRELSEWEQGTGAIFERHFVRGVSVAGNTRTVNVAVSNGLGADDGRPGATEAMRNFRAVQRAKTWEERTAPDIADFLLAYTQVRPYNSSSS
jgi:hypothetical protein